jgi:hypothetical protein
VDVFIVALTAFLAALAGGTAVWFAQRAERVRSVRAELYGREHLGTFHDRVNETRRNVVSQPINVNDATSKSFQELDRLAATASGTDLRSVRVYRRPRKMKMSKAMIASTTRTTIRIPIAGSSPRGYRV